MDKEVFGLKTLGVYVFVHDPAWQWVGKTDANGFPGPAFYVI